MVPPSRRLLPRPRDGRLGSTPVVGVRRPPPPLGRVSRRLPGEPRVLEPPAGVVPLSTRLLPYESGLPVRDRSSHPPVCLGGESLVTTKFTILTVPEPEYTCLTGK